MNPIEQQVLQTIRKYRLLKKSDKIAVACSGGKDSTAVLYILNKHFPNITAITINAFIGNYSKENLANLTIFCRKLNIPLEHVSFRKEFGKSLCYIQSALKERGVNMNSCAVCGVLKRYLLNKKARELKMDVLVTGHNLDDEAQSILMNLLRGTPEMLARLGPQSGVVSDPRFIRRVKPLYFVSEKSIEDYARKHRFPVKFSRCPCAVDSYRNNLRTLIPEFEKTVPKAKENIINWFMAHRDKLRNNADTTKIAECVTCGEPASKKQCKACSMLATIRK